MCNRHGVRARWLLVAALVWGGSALRADVRFELLGQWGGAADAVVISGDIAYVGIGPRVVALDICDPGDPKFLGQSPVLLGHVMEIALQDNFAYVAASYNGFQIVDVSDPRNIQWVGGAEVDSQCWDVGVSGDFAYVAAYDEKLLIYDVSDPREPALVATHETSGNTTGLFVTDRCAFVATWYTLDVFDITDPRHATRVAVYPADCSDLVVRDNLAYLAGSDELTILDVSEPSQPAWVGSWGGMYAGQDVAVCGDYAYFTGFDVEVINIANPASPYWVGTAQLSAATLAHEVAATSGHILVAQWWAGLEIFNVSEPHAPESLTVYNRVNHALWVTADRDHACTSGYTPGVQIVDISDPEAPRRTAVYGPVDKPARALVVGPLAYVSWAGLPTRRLDVVDISDPAIPIMIGSVEKAGGDMALQGNLLCLAAGSAGVTFVDMSDPRAPRVVDTIDTGNAWGVAVEGDYACVADIEVGLVVFDISDPEHPRQIGGSPTTQMAISIAFGAGHAYVGLRGGFDIFDVTQPALPVLVGHYGGDWWVEGIDYEDGRVYTSGWLAAFDVRDPAHPRMTGMGNWPSYPMDVDVHDGLLHVAGDSSGLWIFEVHELGDLNCDGDVDLADINPFVMALADPVRYAQRYPGCYIQNGDLNQDELVDFGDINPFIDRLLGER